VQPLETIRAFSRPLAFGLLIVIAARSLGFPRGERLKFVALPTILFLSYELYYVTLIGAFVEPFRGIFGIIGYFAAFAAFALGLPKLMQRPGDSRGLLAIVGLTGVLFIAANFFQLAGGYSNAVIEGRLTGISGNPQQFTMTCCLFLIVGCYFFSTGTAGSWFKWFAGLGLGVIGLFILWSGSRTGAICAVVILLAFFRMKIGRLALLGIVGGGAFAIAVSVFGESLDIVERFFRGGGERIASTQPRQSARLQRLQTLLCDGKGDAAVVENRMDESARFIGPALEMQPLATHPAAREARGEERARLDERVALEVANRDREVIAEPAPERRRARQRAGRKRVGEIKHEPRRFERTRGDDEAPRADDRACSIGRPDLDRLDHR